MPTEELLTKFTKTLFNTDTGRGGESLDPDPGAGQGQEKTSPVPPPEEYKDEGSDRYASYEQFSYSVAQDVAINFAKTISQAGFLDFSFDGAPTNPSRLITLFDLPEVQLDPGKIEFVYNRFEPSEMLSRSGEVMSDYMQEFTSMSESQQHERLRSRYTSPPRYVKINFSHPGIPFSIEGETEESLAGQFKVLNSNGTPSGLRSALNQVLNDLDPKAILTEGGITSFYFSGTELVDTNADTLFFRFLRYATSFQEFYNINDQRNFSPKEKIKNYFENLNTGTNKKAFSAILNSLGQYGFKVQGTSQRANIETKVASHSLAFNNLFFDSIMKASIDNRANLYEDEFRAYETVTEEIKNNVISNFTMASVSEDDFVTHVNSNTLYDYNILPSAEPEIYNTLSKSAVAHAGYVVEKIEIMPDGTLTALPPFKLSKDATTIIDPDVAYGANYVYKVRSIYAVEYDCITPVPGLEDSQIVRCVFIVASSPNSMKILCTETEAPDPPSSTYFKYSHKKQGLEISWDFPKNPQGDIKGFQVFRRISINDPFTLIKEYDFDNSIIPVRRTESATSDTYFRLVKNGKPYVMTHCLDEEFTKKSSFIYAIASFDAHGHSSNYGAQFKVTYDKRTRKLKKHIISRSGGLKAYPNIFINQDAFVDTMKVSGKNRMNIFFDPEYYQLIKKNNNETYGSDHTTETNVEFLNTTLDDNVTHKIHFLNTDLIKDNILQIKVTDNSTDRTGLGYPELEPNNLSFTFK